MGRVGKSDYFDIRYEAADPKDAAAIAQAVSDSYNKVQAEYVSSRRDNVIGLLEREKELRAKDVDRLRDLIRKRAINATGLDPFNPYQPATVMEAGADGQNVLRLRLKDPTSPLTKLQGDLSEAEVRISVLKAKIKAFDEGKKS